MGVRHTLLQTPPERVPHELAQAVIDFSRDDPNVRSAFVGLTSVTEDFNFPQEELAAAFALDDESEAELQAFADRFYVRLPASIQAGGCNVLEPAALADWTAKAQRVFSR